MRAIPRALRREQFIAVTVLLLVFAGMAVSTIYYKFQYAHVNSVVHAQYALKVWQPGEIIGNSDFMFRFNSARSDTHTIPHMWELADGQKFVIVNVSFKNTTGVVYHLSPIKTMQLKDASGKLYSVTSAPYIQDSLGGPVAPGQTVSGEVGFTVPTGATDLQFVFEPRIANAHTIFVTFKVD